VLYAELGLRNDVLRERQKKISHYSYFCNFTRVFKNWLCSGVQDFGVGFRLRMKNFLSLKASFTAIACIRIENVTLL